MDEYNTLKEDVAVVAKFDNAVDANIVRGMLESNGIVAGVMGDSTANALLRTPMRVIVMASDLERARELLNEQ